MNRQGSVDELENRAAREREQLNRDVVELREEVRREMDLRSRAKDAIRAKPAAFYGTAAGAALFAGFALARILK